MFIATELHFAIILGYFKMLDCNKTTCCGHNLYRFMQIRLRWFRFWCIFLYRSTRTNAKVSSTQLSWFHVIFLANFFTMQMLPNRGFGQLQKEEVPHFLRENQFDFMWQVCITRRRERAWLSLSLPFCSEVRPHETCSLCVCCLQGDLCQQRGQ